MNGSAGRTKWSTPLRSSMSDGYDDLPYLFEKHGFHDRASALRRLISERDALLEEAVGFRKQETQRVEEQTRAELEEVQAAYATVANIRGNAKTALMKYGD